MKIVSSNKPKNRDFVDSEWKIDKPLKFYYRTASKSCIAFGILQTLLAQLNFWRMAMLPPNGQTGAGHIRSWLYWNIKWQICFFFFLHGAVKPWFNWKEEEGGLRGGGKTEKERREREEETSLVREEYKMEREEKCLKTKQKEISN